MLGHKSIKTTRHYAKILDLKVSNDMQILKKILGMPIKLQQINRLDKKSKTSKNKRLASQHT
jgi:hypothetical protein